MKDKEIIIDGVDVSGCEYLSKYGNSCRLMQPFGFCKPQDRCLYKQLKRMEQKNADLNDENETLKKIKDFACINLKNYIADNDKLKANNDRLKENYIKLCQQKHLDDVRWQKRCTYLQEIKKYIAKICKEECGYVQKKRCPDCDCRYGAILDLITKEEEE